MNFDSSQQEQRSFRKWFGVIVLAHLGLASLPIAWVQFGPAVAISNPPRPAEARKEIQWIDPAMVLAAPASMADPAPPIAPQPEPVREVFKPTPKRESPKPQLVKNESAAARKVTMPQVTKFEKLAPDAPVDPAPAASPKPAPKQINHVPDAAAQDQINEYHRKLQQRMEQQWNQPKHISLEQAPMAKIGITVSRGGKVSGQHLAVSSGHAEVDESALAAARAVTQIDPLPSGIPDDSYEVIIRFVLH
jgi:TonB family protein